MNIAIIVIGIAILAGIGTVISLLWKRKAVEGISTAEYERLKAELDRKLEDITEMKVKIEKTQSEKDEMSGKNKAMFAELTNIKADLKSLSSERDRLTRQVQEFEANSTRRDKEFNDRLQKLDSSKEKLDEERARVIREDEARIQAELEARDRIWADHENAVIATLTDLCKLPAFSFTSYTNTNLPDGFDGSLKPDFMIDFLGQYVIFDAKVSKAKSLKTYIDEQVRKTVDKVKKNDKIYKSIFLVVPATALAELKNHHYTVDGYQIYVISPEALAPVLASLKRITAYEFAEALDPMQRENIVQMIADFDFHINLRNATDIILSTIGADLLEKAKKTDPALAEEIELKKAPMNAKASIAAADIKKLVISLAHQKEHIGRMVSPKASINQQILSEAQEMLNEKLF